MIFIDIINLLAYYLELIGCYCMFVCLKKKVLARSEELRAKGEEPEYVRSCDLS